jgi:hypothetical protein
MSGVDRRFEPIDVAAFVNDDAMVFAKQAFKFSQSR